MAAILSRGRWVMSETNQSYVTMRPGFIILFISGGGYMRQKTGSWDFGIDI